jgi:hypothetical protein
MTMFFRIDSSRCLQQLWELDRLIAENSRQVIEQRHVLSRLAGFSEEAELVGEFVEELLSAQKFYTEDREKLLVALRG